MGGSLASIHSQQQQDFITSLASASSPQPVYLGLYDAFKNGTWVWADGTPVDYKNWGASKPTTRPPAENGVWDDDKCCGNAAGICQMPDPDACPCPLNWTHLPETNSCYKLDFNGTSASTVTIRRTFAEARASCLAQGADLVSVHSHAEFTFTYAIAGTVATTPAATTWPDTSIWVGLSRNATNQQFAWSDGTPLNFNAIGADNGPGTLCAAFIALYNGVQTNGQWHDIECWRPFKWAICKKKAFTG